MRMLGALIAGLIVAVVTSSADADDRKPDISAKPEFGPHYSGQLLVARPGLKDPRFKEAVIYLGEHSAEGAFGLVLNKPLSDLAWTEFLKGMGLPSDGAEGKVRIYFGGPVDRDGGFVFHTSDYSGPRTAMARGRYAITSDPTLLARISEGKGPRRHRVIFGHSGWSPGQLEREFERGDWDVIPADEELIFDGPISRVWARARARIGIRL